MNDFLGLFSADFFGSRLDDWLAVTAVHLIFACLVAGALFLALRAFGRDFLGGDLIAQLLAVAIVINLLAYLLLYPGSGATVREIAPVFGLGGALAGRVLAEPLLRRRLEPLLALGAVAAVVAAVPPLVIAKPPPPAAAGLARFLEGHDLTRGLAGYWNADSTTLDSRGRVVVAPVKYHPGHGLAAAPVGDRAPAVRQRRQRPELPRRHRAGRALGGYPGRGGRHLRPAVPAVLLPGRHDHGVAQESSQPAALQAPGELIRPRAQRGMECVMPSGERGADGPE